MNNKIAKIYSEIQQIQEELTEKSYCIRNPASYYSSHEEQIRFNQEDRLNYIKLEKNLKELQTKIKLLVNPEEITYNKNKTLIKNIPYIELTIKNKNECKDINIDINTHINNTHIVEPERLVMFQPRCQICLCKNNDGLYMTEIDRYYKIGFVYCDNDNCKKIAEESRKAYIRKNEIIELQLLFPNKNGTKQILPIIVPRSKLNDNGTPFQITC